MKLSYLLLSCLLTITAACGASKSNSAKTSSQLLCPDTQPTVGAACDANATYDDYLACRYGDQCPPCGSGVECKNDVWVLAANTCQNVNDLTACPTADPNTTNMTPCSTNGAYCHAGESVCGCTIFVNAINQNNQWGCTFPMTDPNCPRWAPNAYGSCAPEGASCSYSCAELLNCTNGVWVPQSLDCAF